ncbi:response regulator transcription factor [Paenibacillus sp. FSL H8-0034]|uniref:response regulator transcription factor n=1 Tax=Paenibacillus sp. FSL H8-0034 TaxID=2954671 RepID=UPI0030FC9B7E
MKMLLADDEILTLQLMAHIIDWEEMGIEIVGSAINGAQALEMIEDTDPDLLITDIRMPQVDGMELIRRALSSKPDLQIIIVSAYAEFEYAREAIKNGAKGYLLKPLDENELMAVMKEIQKEWLMTAAQQEQEKEMQQMKAEQSWRNLLYAPLPQQMSSSIPLPHTEYRLAVLKTESVTYGEQLHLQETMVEVSKVLQNEIRIRLDRDVFQNILFENYPGEWIFALHASFQVEALDAILQARTDWLGIQILAGISLVKTDLNQLSEAYKEALDSLQYRFFHEDGQIFIYQPSVQDQRLSTNEAFIQSLQRWVDKWLDASTTDYLAEQLWNVIEIHTDKNIDDVYHRFYDLLFVMKMRLWNRDEHTAFQMLDSIRLNVDKKFRSLTELQQFIIDILLELNALRRFEKSEHNPLIYQAKQYIKQHYNTNISLEQICEAVSVSRSYFSTFFKKETGMNVWDYLTEYRIEQAKRMLVETTMKNYEIALEIGYENPSYFTKMFKKQVGISPNEYKTHN